MDVREAVELELMTGKSGKTKYKPLKEEKQTRPDNRFFEALAYAELPSLAKHTPEDIQTIIAEKVRGYREICHEYVTELDAEVARKETAAVLSPQYRKYFLDLEAKLFATPKYANLIKGKLAEQDKQPRYFAEMPLTKTPLNLDDFEPTRLLTILLSLSEDTPLRIELTKQIHRIFEEYPLSSPPRFKELCKQPDTDAVRRAKLDYCKTKDALEHFLFGKSQAEMNNPRKPNLLSAYRYSTAYNTFFALNYEGVWNLNKQQILDRLSFDEAQYKTISPELSEEIRAIFTKDPQRAPEAVRQFFIDNNQNAITTYCQSDEALEWYRNQYVALRTTLEAELKKIFKLHPDITQGINPKSKEALTWLLLDTTSREAKHFNRVQQMYKKHLDAQCTVKDLLSLIEQDEEAGNQLESEIRNAFTSLREPKPGDPRPVKEDPHIEFCKNYHKQALIDRDKMKQPQLMIGSDKVPADDDYREFCENYHDFCEKYHGINNLSEAEKDQLVKNYCQLPSTIKWYLHVYLRNSLSQTCFTLLVKNKSDSVVRIWKKSEDGKEIELLHTSGTDTNTYEAIDILETNDVPAKFTLLTPTSFQPLGSFRDFCHEHATKAGEKINWIKARLGEDNYKKYRETIGTTYTGCPEIDGAILCEVLPTIPSIHVTSFGKNSLDEERDMLINQHGVIENVPDVEKYCDARTIRLHASSDGSYLRNLDVNPSTLGDEFYTGQYEYQLPVSAHTDAIKIVENDELTMPDYKASLGKATVLDETDLNRVLLKINDTAEIPVDSLVKKPNPATQTQPTQEKLKDALILETIEKEGLIKNSVQDKDQTITFIPPTPPEQTEQADRPAPPKYSPTPPVKLRTEVRTLKEATPAGFFVSEAPKPKAAETARPPAPTQAPLPPQILTEAASIINNNNAAPAPQPAAAINPSDNKGKEEATQPPAPATNPSDNKNKDNNLYQAIADGLNNIIDGTYVPLHIKHTEQSLRKIVDDYVCKLPDKNWVETQLNLKGNYTFKEYVDNVQFTAEEQKKKEGTPPPTIPCDINLEPRILCEKLGKTIHVMEVEEQEVEDEHGVKTKHKVVLKHYLYDKNGRREVKPEDIDWASGDVVSLVHDKDKDDYQSFKSYLPRTLEFKWINGVVHIVCGLNLVVAMTPQGAGAMVQAIMNGWSTAGAVAIAYGSIAGKVFLLYFLGFFQFGGFPSNYNKIALKAYNIADYLERLATALDDGSWEWKTDVFPLAGSFALSLIPAIFFGALAGPTLKSFAETIHNNPAKFVGWDNLIWLADHAQTQAAYLTFFTTSFFGNMTSAVPILENIKRVMDKWIKDVKNVSDKDVYEKVRFWMGTAAGVGTCIAVGIGFWNFKGLAFKDIYGTMIDSGYPGGILGVLYAGAMFAFIQGLGFSAALPFGRKFVESAFDIFFGDIQYKEGDFRKDDAQYQGFRAWWKSQPNLHKSFFVFAIGAAGVTDFFGAYPNLFQADTLEHESKGFGVCALIASLVTEFDGTKEAFDKICKAVEKLLKFVGMTSHEFYEWFLSKKAEMPYWKEYKIKIDRIMAHMNLISPAHSAQKGGLFAYRDKLRQEAEQQANDTGLQQPFYQTQAHIPING